MTTNEIRTKYLEFFKSKKHAIVESDSVVPKDDPTVLFTTAGMQQFKRQFLGYTDEYTRATTSQKCLRTDDLDVVGKTNFHHTFFEMLGNFSFGDYFKEEAIEWAWEFFTQVLKIPADKLWVSVYKDDDEAFEIWKNNIKDLDNTKILKLGDHDNFWPADAVQNGPNGPCGPCSEIFFDFGKNPNCKAKKCDPICDCGRFGEVWNLVFTQFDRKDGGVLEPLPSKNIDTGMGLERLAAVLQGKSNNYDIDIFVPIFKSVDEHIDPDGKLTRAQQCLIADHIRAITFGISDGVVPSNEGRGYVIKKLIIDVTDLALRVGNTKPSVFKLVSGVVESMHKPYPDIKKKQTEIEDLIESVERAYIKVRRERLPEFEKKLNKSLKAQSLGELIFKYRDTYGLALNTIEGSIRSAKLDAKMVKSSWNIFKELMNAQQEKSRASSKMSGDVFTDVAVNLGVPKTKFIGYEHGQSTSTILKMLVSNEKINTVKKGDELKIFLDKTPFYAESGGQVGDSGAITRDKNVMRITDTQKFEDIYIHTGVVESGSFTVNDQVTATIDIERRLSIMRNHTATHLLQSALRDTLGSHVKQQGSLVAEDKLRFDFTQPKAIKDEQIERIERSVNVAILSNERVSIDFLDIEQAKKSGALAFFAEKYGKVVRVVTVGDSSKEFCGGTHVSSTGEIGLFKITSESSVAQGIRRIEAKTGTGSLEYVNGILNEAKRVSNLINVPVTELESKVKELEQLSKAAKQVNSKIALEKFRSHTDKILSQAEEIGGAKIISYSADVEANMLRKASDLFAEKTKSFALVMGSAVDGSASILIRSSNDLVQKGLDCNQIIKKISPIIKGSGGGRPQMAQAGGKEQSKIDEAIKEAVKLIKETISS